MKVKKNKLIFKFFIFILFFSSFIFFLNIKSISIYAQSSDDIYLKDTINPFSTGQLPNEGTYSISFTSNNIKFKSIVFGLTDTGDVILSYQYLSDNTFLAVYTSLSGWTNQLYRHLQDVSWVSDPNYVNFFKVISSSENLRWIQGYLQIKALPIKVASSLPGGIHSERFIFYVTPTIIFENGVSASSFDYMTINYSSGGYPDGYLLGISLSDEYGVNNIVETNQEKGVFFSSTFNTSSYIYIDGYFISDRLYDYLNAFFNITLGQPISSVSPADFTDLVYGVATAPAVLISHLLNFDIFGVRVIVVFSFILILCIFVVIIKKVV